MVRTQTSIHFVLTKMDTSKLSVSGTMRVRTYEVLARAVEEGFRRGWSRAHKYSEHPTHEQLEENVINCILGDICEVFDFDDP